MQINSPAMGQTWPAEQFASSPSLTMAISPLMSAHFSAMPISNPQPTKYNYASQPSLWPNVVSWMNLVYEKIAVSIIWDFLEGCFKGANSLGKRPLPVWSSAFLPPAPMKDTHSHPGALRNYRLGGKTEREAPGSHDAQEPLSCYCLGQQEDFHMREKYTYLAWATLCGCVGTGA